MDSQRHLFDVPADVPYLNAGYLGPRLHRVEEAGRAAPAPTARPWETSRGRPAPSGRHPRSSRELLTESRVYVSVRGASIRVSPHVYDDAADVARLLEVLERAQGAAPRPGAA